MMARRLIKMYFHVLKICLMLSGFSLNGFAQSEVFASDDSLISLADFQQKSMPLMLEVKEILQLADRDLIDLLNFPLEEAWRNGQLDSSHCDQAFQQAIQKHLQIQSLQFQSHSHKDQFRIWNQAPSLRGRSNLINTDLRDAQQLNARIGIRLTIPTDVLDRKKAWDARRSAQHWEIEAEKEELQQMIYDLHLNLHQTYRLLLLKNLQMRYLSLKQKKIEEIFNQGLMKQLDLDQIKHDVLMMKDDWLMLNHHYQMLQYDLFDLTNEKMIGGHCKKITKKEAKIKVLQAEVLALKAERQAKESWQIDFLEMGWQQQQFIHMGYLSIGIKLPWHDPTHKDHIEAIKLIQESKLLEEIQQKEIERKSLEKSILMERVQEIVKILTTHPKSMNLDFDWQWWIRMKQRKYEGHYELLRLMDED